MNQNNLEKIPSELKTRPQWVLWKSEIRNGKSTKIPYRPQDGSQKAETNNSATWGTYETATTKAGFSGIGYVFSPDDPYAGIDLDSCRSVETGEIESWAREIITQLNSYTEVSQSGRGIHIILKGQVPPGGNRRGKVEMYDSGRYFVLTGQHLAGTPTTIEDRQAQLTTLHTEIFGVGKKETPPPTPGLQFADEEIIAKARAAQNGNKFDRLMKGDISEYDNDDSRTDLALCSILAFWTQRPEQIDRIFRQSGLMRPKWDEKHYCDGRTYGQGTIQKALTGVTETYQGDHKGACKTEGEQPQVGGATDKPILKTITAKDLAAKEFPPRRWAIPDLITEGVTILAGPPKVGKSWLALDFAGAVASGGTALGKIQVEMGEVLYLALEDSERRLQERLEILPHNELSNLHIVTASNFPPLHKGGIEALTAWLQEHPAVRLVIIDTLGRVKPEKKKNQDSYDHDTAIITVLQKLSFDHQVAFMVVHHTRKQKADSAIEEVSGTFGLTGAADCIAVLSRKSQGQMDGTLKITGRDIEEQELALKFDSESGQWNLLGEDPTWFGKSQQRQDILLLLKENGPMTLKEVAEFLKKPFETVGRLLRKMKTQGELEKVDGKYDVHRGGKRDYLNCVPSDPVCNTIHSAPTDPGDPGGGGSGAAGGDPGYNVSTMPLRRVNGSGGAVGTP